MFGKKKEVDLSYQPTVFNIKCLDGTTIPFINSDGEFVSDEAEHIKDGCQDAEKWKEYIKYMARVGYIKDEPYRSYVLNAKCDASELYAIITYFEFMHNRYTGKLNSDNEICEIKQIFDSELNGLQLNVVLMAHNFGYLPAKELKNVNMYSAEVLYWTFIIEKRFDIEVCKKLNKGVPFNEIMDEAINKYKSRYRYEKGTIELTDEERYYIEYGLKIKKAAQEKFYEK